MGRWLVTIFGGTGFIGRHLVQRLASSGWIVRVGCRDVEAAPFLKPLGDPGQIIPLAADITRLDTVAAAVDGAQAVVNLVGILYERGPRTFQRIHVDGAATVARAAAEAGADRLVHLSAIGSDPASEAAYGRTKAAGEQAVLAAFPTATVLRPSVVFGPEDDFFNRFAALSRVLPVLPVFPTAFQPVYVGDVAEAVRTVLDDPTTSGQTYKLGGPRVIDFREIMELLLAETARKRLLVPIPLFVASIEAAFLEHLPVPPLTRDQVKLLANDNVVSEGALTFADLGIEPTAVESIIPTYLRRYRPQVKQRRRTAE